MGKNICRFCGQAIVNRGNNEVRRVFCSAVCSKRGHQKQQVERRRQCNIQARLGLSGGAIGAVNEQVVAIDLIKRGWQVYTAFEPTHSFDILAIRPGHQIRIEVKTETVLPSGYLIVNMKKTQQGKHDVLAKVRNLGETITYEPELPEGVI